MRVETSLASDQAALVAALVRGDDAGQGFDDTRLRAMSELLRGKRRNAVARSCPAVPRALGDQFTSRFDEFARTVPLPTGGDALSDAGRFLGWLRRRAPLPRELCVLCRSLRLRRAVRALAFLR